MEEELACMKFSRESKAFCDEKGLECILHEETYDKTNYQDTIDRIMGGFNFELFTDKINTFFHNPDLNVHIRASAYGTYGYYWPDDNIAFVNIHHPGDLISTVKHEIIHLILHPYAEKFKLSHEEKEAMVNSLQAGLL